MGKRVFPPPANARNLIAQFGNSTTQFRFISTIIVILVEANTRFVHQKLRFQLVPDPRKPRAMS